MGGKLSELLACVEVAIEGSDELDRRLHEWTENVVGEWQEYRKDWAYHRDGFWVGIGNHPRYSSSIDAAVALVEKRLPEGGWEAYSAVHYKNGIEPARGNVFDWRGGGYTGKGATPALAILVALLRAEIEAAGKALQGAGEPDETV